MRLVPTRVKNDRGAYAIIYAVAMVALLGMAALVMDIASIRADRRDAKSAADAAVLAGAGALGLTSPNPRLACTNAVQFAAASLGSIAGTGDCSFFPETVNCTTTTAMISRPFTTSDGWTIEVFWPVSNVSGLMLQPSVERHTSPPVTQAIAAADGSPCSRVGSRVQRTRPLLLASGLGFSSATRSQDSVALAEIRPGDGKLVAPLLVLDRKSCNALNVTGNGGVLVKSSVLSPGVIAVDSDGTGGEIDCNGGKKVVTVTNNSLIHAEDNASGAKALILSFALPDNLATAYEPTNTSDTCQPTPGTFNTILCPKPTAQGARITRDPFDQRYNNCTGPCTAGKDYINQFKRYVGLNPTTGSFTPGPPMPVSATDACSTVLPTYTGTTYLACSSGSKTITVSGETVIDGGGGVVRIDAKTLNVTGTLVFKNAQVNLNVETLDVNGCLVFNPPDVFVGPTETLAQTCAATTALQTTFGYQTTKDLPPVWVAGEIRVGGSFIARQTFIMQPRKADPLNGRLLVSTNGRVYWSAPYGKSAVPADTCIPATGPTVAPSATCFEDLSLWNEWDGPSNNPDVLSGQSQLFVDGTFFVPEAGFTFGGGSSQSQTRAQFVAERLNLNGGGLLTMTPDAERSTPIPFVVGALIR